MPAGYGSDVATYETILTVPHPIDVTFAFVSDFRNAARWDPRTYSAEKATDGPIGVGTRFMLTGGLMREDFAQRMHLPTRLIGMPLPYDIVEFDPPNEFVLKGETGLVGYCDRLRFSATEEGTSLRYSAQLEMKGPMRIGEPLLRRVFTRIGDEATRGLPAAVER